MSETQQGATRAGKPTEQEMTEILARAMGWSKDFAIRDPYDDKPGLVWRISAADWVDARGWNPFADPEGLGPIREVERGLSEEQWSRYHLVLQDALMKEAGSNGVWAMSFRHASPAICAEALARTFEPGRF